jgi:hypothetical protein
VTETFLRHASQERVDQLLFKISQYISNIYQYEGSDQLSDTVYEFIMRQLDADEQRAPDKRFSKYLICQLNMYNMDRHLKEKRGCELLKRLKMIGGEKETQELSAYLAQSNLNETYNTIYMSNE